MNRYKKEQGFTLIEILVVLFIIGLIIAIALPNLKSAGENAREKADLANRNLIGAQADNYYLQHGSYPKSVQVLVDQGYLRSIPTCPWGDSPYVIQAQSGSQKANVSCR